MALAALILLFISVGPGAVMADPAHVTLASVLETPAQEAPAIGHVRPLESGMPIGILMSVGVALLGWVALRCLKVRGSRGRVLALGLSLALGVFTLEMAVHSVHHLADPETAATCPVLSGSQHLWWGEAQGAATDAPPLCLAPAPFLRAEDAPQSLVYRPHQGRAPPA
jgi:hypothetical protein